MGLATFVALRLAALGVEASYLFYIPAILLCYLFGSIATALASVLISGLLTWYFFIPPVWSFEIASPYYGITLLLFVSVSLMMCAAIYDVTYDLNRRVKELTEKIEGLRAKDKQAQAEDEENYE